MPCPFSRRALYRVASALHSVSEVIVGISLPTPTIRDELARRQPQFSPQCMLMVNLPPNVEVYDAVFGGTSPTYAELNPGCNANSEPLVRLLPKLNQDGGFPA